VKIEFVRERLATHLSREPVPSEEFHAAVAIVFRDGPEGVELLLIERAQREGDPWSGHMAFPGGRLEAEDESSRWTAQRETREEVGIELDRAEYLGQLEGIAGNPRSRPKMVVAAHAFVVTEHQPFELDPREVEDAFWFPLPSMLDESRSVEFSVPQRPGQRYPGVLVGQPDRHVVWGLTYRFLQSLVDLLGHSLPGASSRPRGAAS
jgi:8-oxo-dGTP pyrophosphatase MutT (NUDIX family)